MNSFTLHKYTEEMHYDVFGALLLYRTGCIWSGAR